MPITSRLLRTWPLLVGCLLAFGAPLAEEASPLDRVREMIADGDYSAAKSEARSLLGRVEQSEGQDSPESADVLDVLVEALWRSGEAQGPETRRLAERAVEIRERALGAEHASVADSLNNLAVICYFGGEFDDAQQHWERALAIREATAGPDSLEAAQLMNNLGNLLQVSGDLSRAARLYERSLAIREAALPDDDPLVAQSLNNLGVLLNFTGDFARALPLAERALEIKEKTLGPDHPKVAESLTALANLLWETGDYARGLPMLERAQKIWEEGREPNDVNVAGTLNNRAEQYRQLGRYDEAREFYERALAIYEEAYEPDHPDIALCLSSLAYLLEETGDYEQAIRHQERALAIREATMDAENPDLATSLHNLGTLLTRTGEFSRARPMLQSAVSIRRASCGPEHPWVAESLNGLAALLAYTGERDRVLELAVESERISRDHLRLSGRSFSEQHALRYATARARGLNLALTLASGGSGSVSSRSALDALIRSRAVVLDEVAARNRSVVLAADPEVAVLAERLRETRTRLANLTVRGPAGEDTVTYLGLLEGAREDKERAERELAAASVEFAREQQRDRIGLDDVIDSLPDNAALVAVALFDRWDLSRVKRADGKSRPANYDGIPSYMAFVLRPGGQSVAVPLGPASELAPLVSEWKSETARGATDFRREPEQAEADYREVGERLRRRIWDPLVPHLGNAKRVFLVPDGVLNLVSWAALPVGESQYLVEQERIVHYLAAERDLVPPEQAVESGRGLLAFGGPDYDTSAVAASASGTRAATRASCGGFEDLRFSPLPASAEEALEIATMWRLAESTRAGAPGEVLHFRGGAATEAAFKAKAPGRRVLHLATHGFFLGGDCISGRGARGLNVVSTEDEESITEGLPPLLLSGLALAGANRRRSAGSADQDGLLTAEEIVSLDLSGVEWAVLSACDTGVGEVHAGEGVLGLRRAMQVAGVRTLIMSLWPVDDESTRQWMGALYDGRLNDHLDTARAVQQAGLTVLGRRRDAGESTHPFYWSAFVAAGDWR